MKDWVMAPMLYYDWTLLIVPPNDKWWFPIEKSIYNSLSNSATFWMLWLHVLLFRLIPIKKIFWNYFPILGQLYGLMLPDALPRAISLNSYSSSDLSSSQQWLTFPAVVQALWLDTHPYMNTYLYTNLYIHYTYTQRICICLCIKILLGISALMFLSSVSIKVMEILAKLRKWQAYFIFTQLICWRMILRGPSYLNTYCKMNE